MRQTLQPANAPAAWRHGGGEKVKTSDGSRSGGAAAPVPMGSRPGPASDVMVFGLAALQWAEGRARFLELGIPPRAFDDDPDAKRIAAAFLNPDPWGAEIDALLIHDDGRVMPWLIALGTYRPHDGAWAVFCIDRLAAVAARCWLPEFLRWGAERLEAGAWMLAQAVDSFAWLLDLAARSEGRAG